MKTHTLFVEKRPQFALEAKLLLDDLRESLNLPGISSLRLLNRYVIDGIDEETFEKASATILSEPQVDTISTKLVTSPQESAFAFSYQPGQFDQRADSAAQCIQLLTGKEKPFVSCAKIIVLDGHISSEELNSIKSFVINPVDSREISLLTSPGRPSFAEPKDVAILKNFLTDSPASIREELSLAMSEADVAFTQKYFSTEENRPPSITEIRMLDTYWSDHCRHTTFFTSIEETTFDPGTEIIEETYQTYREVRKGLNRDERPVTLMDIAVIGMRELRASGELDNLEVSEEINAASIVVPVTTTSLEGETTTEEWLVQFKNETHNHPTEIEPFGGASTCLGGCIRDPLSGRSYVYQAMRITGAADPLTPYSETLPGKLPQKNICQVAAKGYASYGNQIGVPAGEVAEIYHPGYVAKRMECGAVVSATPRQNVFRGSPAPGDVILLIGGRTGRDGVGGATGSSRENTDTAIENSAEVQKGDAPMERKIQRLFRNPELARKIKICNDFGAGGVSVAIGEIAPSLLINLDTVPTKYEGLDGTELAISESQERMAVCVDPSDIDFFIAEADKENLECTHVADVTDSGRLVMTWRGKTIVDLSRAFLDTNGVQQTASIHVTAPADINSADSDSPASLKQHLASLNIASQKGLGEIFDGSAGGNTVLWPFGGKNQLTPPDAMVAKLPVIDGSTDHATYMAWGFDPYLSEKSPFHGAAYAVTESVCKAVAAGARLSDIRLTLQEFFPSLGNDPKRWGLPFAALLGAFRAQHELRLGAIGGKDSMSGSFNEIDVPPTLVSFALAPGLASLAISPEFKKSDSAVSLIQIAIQENGLPDFSAIRETADALYELNKAGKILSLHHVGGAGIGAALTKMALGNGIGFQANENFPTGSLTTAKYFTFLIEHAASDSISATIPSAQQIGTTTAAETLALGSETHELADLRSAWTQTLEPIYPTAPALPVNGEKAVAHTSNNPLPAATTKADTAIAKPRVLIPVFPGTNSEYESALAFNQAGADSHIQIFRNLSPAQIEESISALAQQIADSQILFLPGGMSTGDEPDGSAKFISLILRNPRISDAIADLLENRDGLILGISNGFQALLKTGLVINGKISEACENSPTFAQNNVARHVSQYVHTTVSNNSSPWLANTSLGEVHTLPVSHAEGRFHASEETIAELFKNGQVATQYSDHTGTPTLQHPLNPNGSAAAIEGITSPCGKVFGKMAHSERFSKNVAKNIPGQKNQPIFAAGVQYFAG